MVDISLLGTGGMMPLPERALTALYVRHNGRALLVDCGEGTQTALRRTPFNFKPIEAILFTHHHADHISGLPGLLLSLGNETKDSPVTIYGPTGTEKIVRSLLAIAPELTFQLNFFEFDANEVSHFDCIGLNIDVIQLKHRIPCVGYRFELKRKGKFNPVRAKELGIPVNLWSKLQNGESSDGFSPQDVLGEPRKSISFLYATDTRPVVQLSESGKNADLMILEGMFGDSAKKERAEETRHMMMQEAAEIAKEAGAKELWLTHYSPATQHPEQYSDELKEIFPNTVFGKDGMTKTLYFPE